MTNGNYFVIFIDNEGVIIIGYVDGEGSYRYSFDWDYFWRKVGIVSGFVGGVAIVGGLIGYGVYAGNIRPQEVNRNKLTVERNVVENNDLAKFTGNAIIVSKQDTNYFLELFGVAIKTPGDTPIFSSLTYNIDHALYEKVFQYMDIEYTYGRDGQIIGAENKLRDNLSFWFPKEKANYAERDIFRALVEVTKERALSINYMGTAQSLSEQTAAKADLKDMTILNIGKPVINQENKTISFVINTVDKVENTTEDAAKLSLKSFQVSQPLNTQNILHPEKIYVDYLQGKGTFELSHQEDFNIKNHEIYRIEQNFGADTYNQNTPQLEK